MPASPLSSFNADLLRPLNALTNPYPGMTEPVRRRRLRRLKHLPNRPSTAFHLMSRIADGLPFFDETDKEALTLILRRFSRFCGLQLLTFCIMGNHFHALVRVPNRSLFLSQFDGPNGESRLLQHLRILYSQAFIDTLNAQLFRWRQENRPDLAERCLNSLKARFCDISIFLKEVKARFARWYNKRRSRRGVLWMGRFHSVLVEDRSSSGPSSPDALQVMAAYIDLNPVRAGLVDCPEHYRWSGWSTALSGDPEAIAGLCRIVGANPRQGADNSALRAYRARVSERRQLQSVPQPSPDTGTTSLLQTVRAFSSGVALGSAAFIEALFNLHRDSFGPHRQSGARRASPCVDKNLKALRLLQ